MKGRRRTATDSGSRHMPTRQLRVCVRGQRRFGYLDMGSGLEFTPATDLGLRAEDLLRELDRLMRERRAVEV